MSLVGNERAKLLASALDLVSTVCITVGIATPLSGLLYGGRGLNGSLFAACYVWLVVTVGLHLAARRARSGD